VSKRYRPRGSPGRRDLRGWLDPRRNHQGSRVDVVCRCGAYKFPHRQFAGRCRFGGWIESFFDPFGRDCRDCINRDGMDCQVVTGAEEPLHCPELRDYIRYESIVLAGRARAMMDRHLKKDGARHKAERP
jgi:hypothetical protein